MGCIISVKEELRFPGRNLSGTAFAMSVPGPRRVDGVAQDSDGAATIVELTDGVVSASSSTTFRRSASIASIKYSVPRRNGMPPSAIAIAPDSAIAQCDVSVNGESNDLKTVRISPGNPFIGVEDLDFLNISVPTPIPFINIDTSATSQSAWDAKGIPGGTGIMACFPLRLNLYYGGTPDLTAQYRSNYFAYWAIKQSAANSTALYMCIDGRNQVFIHAWMATATASYTLSGVIANSVNNAIVDTAVEKSIGTGALTAGLNTIAVTGLVGFPILKLVITDSSGTATGHHIRMMASDYT